MRTRTKSALLSLLCCVVSFAQEKSATRVVDSRKINQAKTTDSRQTPVGPRPLTYSEGLAILGAALETRDRSKSSTDCSHLVQDIYERAGFPYSYVNSSELYGGIDEFRRVTSPQPGDLAVWRGHVGIVINPAQHSFFSLLKSGHGVEKYDSDYWRKRGRPRFFRYVKASPEDAHPEPVANATLKSAGFGVKPQARLDVARVLTEPVESIELETSDAPVDVQPLPTTVSIPGGSASKPDPKQLNAALLKAFDSSEPALRARDLFTLTQSVTVFDQFEVKKVHISGNQGWAEVQIREAALLGSGGAKVSRRSQRQRWSMQRRNNSDWELSLPPNAVYLSRDIAVRLLARQLVELVDGSPKSAPVTRQKAELARLLDSLLKQ